VVRGRTWECFAAAGRCRRAAAFASPGLRQAQRRQRRQQAGAAALGRGAQSYQRCYASFDFSLALQSRYH